MTRPRRSASRPSRPHVRERPSAWPDARTCSRRPTGAGLAPPRSHCALLRAMLGSRALSLRRRQAPVGVAISWCRRNGGSPSQEHAPNGPPAAPRPPTPPGDRPPRRRGWWSSVEKTSGCRRRVWRSGTVCADLLLDQPALSVDVSTLTGESSRRDRSGDTLHAVRCGGGRGNGAGDRVGTSTSWPHRRMTPRRHRPAALCHGLGRVLRTVTPPSRLAWRRVLRVALLLASSGQGSSSPAGNVASSRGLCPRTLSLPWGAAQSRPRRTGSGVSSRWRPSAPPPSSEPDSRDLTATRFRGPGVDAGGQDGPRRGLSPSGRSSPTTRRLPALKEVAGPAGRCSRGGVETRPVTAQGDPWKAALDVLAAGSASTWPQR